MEHGLRVRSVRSIFGPLTGQNIWLAVALPALSVTFGVQMLRALIPMTLFDARLRLPGDPTLIGILVVTVVAAAVVIGASHRLRQTRYPLVVSAAGLALIRLAVQVWEGDLMVDWHLSLIGMTFFAVFLSAYLRFAQSRGSPALANLGPALLLGLFLETTITAAFGTWPLFWRESTGALGVIAVLVAVQLASLTVAVRPGRLVEAEPPPTRGGISFGHSLPLLAAGAWLFLQLQVFQNVARLSTLAGWELPGAFFWTAFANGVGLMAAVWSLAHPRQANWQVVALMGIALVLALSFERQNAAVAAITLLGGQVAASALFMLVLTRLGASGASQRAGSGTGSTSISIGLVLLTTMVFILAYY